MTLYYLLVAYHITGMTSPSFLPNTTYIRHNSQSECMATAKTEIPKNVALITSRAQINKIDHYCLPVYIVQPQDAPKKRCETHMGSEYCLRGV